MTMTHISDKWLLLLIVNKKCISYLALEIEKSRKGKIFLNVEELMDGLIKSIINNKKIFLKG